jgi:exodeoxyribonuclease VII small subunit
LYSLNPIKLESVHIWGAGGEDLNRVKIDPCNTAGLAYPPLQQSLINHVPRKKKQPPFEEALSELESLVETLEQGEQSLEESLKSFERGVELTRTCQKALDEAEQKVRILSSESEVAELEPFKDDD